MTQVAAAVCPGCGLPVTVFAHQLLAEILPAAHNAVARSLARAEGADGARFAVAEGDGSYVCPACGRLDWVPLSIDLD
jgi:predicted RNA-binding Zn-ribbon protein involved in translation (DUF1610 family)